LAKRNKLRKKRLKRHLRNRLKAVEAIREVSPKPIPSTLLLLGTYKAENKEYQTELDGLFDRKILVVERFINKNASLIHFCQDCKNRFYAKPKWMLNGVQPHVCFSTNTTYSPKKATPKIKKKGKDVTWDQFQQLVSDGLTPQQIAKELKVNPELIRNWFKSEGLI